MDILIHQTQSIHSKWYAKPSFVKDLEHMFSINTSLHAAWRARMLGVQSQASRWKMTTCLKKQYVLRIDRWSLEFDQVKTFFLLVGECDQVKTRFLLAITWILFTSLRTCYFNVNRQTVQSKNYSWVQQDWVCSEWFEKLEFVCNFSRVKQLDHVNPHWLTWRAFVVY